VTLPTPAPADVVELIGNPRSGSRTRALADAATRALTDRLAQAGEPLSGTAVLELADLVTVSFSGRPAPDRVVPTTDPLAQVRGARLLIVATPTYKATYTGLLKVFLDQLGHRELDGAVAVPVAVAAAEPHRQAVGAALHALLVELGAGLPAEPLALLEPQLDATDEVVADWADRNAERIAGALRGQG
jgi:FMN reductase